MSAKSNLPPTMLYIRSVISIVELVVVKISTIKVDLYEFPTK